MDRDYIPKFSFEITEEMKARADRLLAVHGIRKAIMTVILDDLLNLVDEHGQMVIGAILQEAVKPREVIKSMAKAERAVKK